MIVGLMISFTTKLIIASRRLELMMNIFALTNPYADVERVTSIKVQCDEDT